MRNRNQLKIVQMCHGKNRRKARCIFRHHKEKKIYYWDIQVDSLPLPRMSVNKMGGFLFALPMIFIAKRKNKLKGDEKIRTSCRFVDIG